MFLHSEPVHDISGRRGPYVSASRHKASALSAVRGAFHKGCIAQHCHHRVDLEVCIIDIFSVDWQGFFEPGISRGVITLQIGKTARAGITEAVCRACGP